MRNYDVEPAPPPTEDVLQRLRDDNARLTAEVERLREAFLIVPLQCDCGDTIKQYTDHAADCPYGIRERALAVPK